MSGIGSHSMGNNGLVTTKIPIYGQPHNFSRVACTVVIMHILNII